ncbi:MAG: sulfurtransferase TusA family protein [Magnetococcales bacterium]|nr:sulfurtransferase TusA family protein [Magnetococcales bacterium]
MSDSAQILDAKNLLCPLPILRAEQAIRPLAVGAVIEIHATDPGLVNDLPAWCSVNGHHILEIRHEGRVVIGLVKKGA